MEDDTTVDVLRSKVKEVLGEAAGASDEESEVSTESNTSQQTPDIGLELVECGLITRGVL